MYRKGSYIAARLIGLLVVLCMAAVIAIQTPRVQTKLSEAVIDRLKDSMEGIISYDQLAIMPSGAVLLKNAVIMDSDPYTEDEFGRGFEAVDTLFKADRITATFSLKNLFSKEEGFHIKRINVDNACLHIVMEPSSERADGSIDNLSRIFNLPETDNVRNAPGAAIISANKLTFRHFHFKMTNFTEAGEDSSVGGMNFDDMDLVSNLEAENFKIKGSRFFANCTKINAVEKSGYTVLNLRGKVEAGQGKVLIENLELKDLWSDLYLDYLILKNQTPKSYSNFVSEVEIETKFNSGKNSLLSPQSLYYFSGEWKNNLSQIDISRGHFKGYVNDFKLKELRFIERTSGISAEASCAIVGLPEVDKMIVDAQVKNLNFTTRSLSRLLSMWMPGDFSGIRQFAPQNRFRLNLNASGPLNKLRLNAGVSTNKGRVALKLDVRNLIDKYRDNEIYAELSSDNLNIGQLLGENVLGELSMFTKASAIIGDKGLQNLTIDSLNVEQIHFQEELYNNISASGEYRDGRLVAKLKAADPKLSLNMEALADLKSIAGNSRYILDAEVQNIDLNAFRVDNRDAHSNISFDLECDLLNRSGKIDGELSIDKLLLKHLDVEKELGDVKFIAYSDDIQQYFELQSPIFDMNLNSSGSLMDVLSDIQNLSIRRELPAVFGLEEHDSNTRSYDLNLRTRNTRDIFDFIMPGLYLADESIIHLSIAEGGDLVASINSERFAYQKNYIRDLDLQIDNIGESLNASIYGSELSVANINFSSPLISASADNDEFDISVSAGEFLEEHSGVRFFVDGMFYRDSLNNLVLKARPHDSFVALGLNNTWILNESEVATRKNELYIKDFRLRNGEQELLVDGGYSEFMEDTLALRVRNIDMSTVNKFTKSKLDLKGIINGMAQLISHPEQKSGMLMDIHLDSLSLGGARGGSITIASELSEDRDDLGIYVKQTIGDKNVISASGSYFLDDGRIDVVADLNTFPFALAEPFFQSIFKKMGGGISGSIRVHGATDELLLSSNNLFLNDALVQLSATGVPYTLRGPLRLDNDGLHFDSVRIMDNDGGSISLDGAMLHEQFSNFRLDTRLGLDRIKVVDATSKDKVMVYGNLRVNGNATLSGPVNALNIGATISTTDNGEVHIPVSGSITGSTSDLLTFTERAKEIDPYDEMLQNLEEQSKKSGDINITGQLNIHSGVKAFLHMGGREDNGASFSGDGSIRLNFRPLQSVLDLNGIYSINEGNYQFVLPGVLSKNFKIQEGSSINFSGGIMDTRLDINALYSLKTSLSTLISDANSVATSRQVDCKITISDRLSNPNIAFDVSVPDLDPTTKSQVESALNTTDKVQKQFLALLVMGSFIPDENTGVVNSSQLLLSNATELMSGQLNAILQRLNVPLDVGIGYQSSVAGNEIFDLAISTQLFNNRVIVGGSVGNRRYGNTTATNGDMVGDFDIQIKLDQAGKYRLNLFSHSADAYTNYLDNSQRNGVGFSYIFSPMKKEEENEMKPKVIQIEDEQ